jgi:hemerythrin-like domain-containing protein
MKRSPALAALSRDHHHALEAALRLRRAEPDSVAAAADHLRAFWEPRGRRHFEIEEELILPAVPEDDDDWREAVARVRDEHARIRAGVEDLVAGAGVDEAHALGELMHDHVRFEERRLFGLLEERLAEPQLAALGEAVERAHG